MPKTFEILKYFPDFHQAVDRRKLLYHVTDAIASRIQEIENEMIGVMKSHWIEAAEDIDELERIAALYGIEREEYEDTNQFRARIKEIILLYLSGPGTVPSVIAFIAIALRKYNVEIERDDEGNIVLIHPVEDKEFRSQSRIYFGEEEGYIEIYENPMIRKSFANSVRYRESWLVKNQGFFNYYPEITIHGYNSRTINPILFNRSKGHILGFRGVIPEKSMLRITANNEGNLDMAELDGRDVKNRMFSLYGSQFDRCNFDDKESRFPIYKPEWAFNEIGFAESLKGEENPPVFEIPLPSIPVGESEWEFRIAKSEFNGSKFDEDAFIFPEDAVGIFDTTHFDNSVFLFDPSAELEMKWEEHQRAMFEVILPCELGIKQINSTNAEEQKRQFIEPLQRVSRVVERIKPAGVKVLVRYGDNEWILGDSVLRSASATEGIGIYCKSALLIK